MTAVFLRGCLAGIGLLCFTALAQAQEQPGETFHLTADQLPKPYATQSAVNSALLRDRQPGQMPLAPPGFRVSLFAEGLDHPRNLVVTPDGTVFLAQSNEDEITLLRDRDGDGRAEQQTAFVTGLDTPHVLALHGRDLFIADVERIWRVALAPGSDRPAAKPVALTRRGALGPAGGHWTRNISIAPDGSTVYAAIGSRGNTAVEKEPRATIQAYRFRADGTLGPRHTFAAGLRNPVGIAFYPGTDRLFTVVNERDGMGDGLVPDYLTEVHEGGFYGWPYAYSGKLPMPGFASKRPDLVRESLTPDVLFQSHSAPLGLAFGHGADLPADWQDDAFVALHGSWNASRPTGYKVVRVEFEGGRPTGRYINFLTGFRLDRTGSTGRARVWGRPAGLAFMPGGGLLVTDDAGGTIWKIWRE